MRKIAHQVSRGPSTTRSGRQFALFYEGKHAGESVFDRAGTDFINIAAKADRVGYVAPDRCVGLFKFAEQKGFYGAIREEHLDCLEMRACHGKDVCRTIDKRGSERLAAKTADVHAFLFADLHGVETGRLAAHRVYTSRGNFDIFSVPKHLAKNPFRDGTAANVTCADKKDAFHDSGGTSGRDSNLGSNVPESICRMWKHLSTPRFYGETRSLFATPRRTSRKEFYPLGSWSLNLSQRYKTRIAPSMETIKPADFLLLSRSDSKMNYAEISSRTGKSCAEIL